MSYKLLGGSKGPLENATAQGLGLSSRQFGEGGWLPGSTWLEEWGAGS